MNVAASNGQAVRTAPPSRTSILPREHGAWVMLTGPLALGAASGSVKLTVPSTYTDGALTFTVGDQQTLWYSIVAPQGFTTLRHSRRSDSPPSATDAAASPLQSSR
ncbi:MAG: YwiC-like family protein [Capsulimonadaceae bacterium]